MRNAAFMSAQAHERLQEAREKAKYDSPTEAARAFGWTEVTYRAHENGTRNFPKEAAQKYAKAFRTSAEWLMFGTEIAYDAEPQGDNSVPLVGYVSAGAEAIYTAAGELGDVPAPDDATPSTVAVEIRGDSLGSFFDRWLVFYDDVKRPITADMFGKPCIVGLADGRVLIKKPQRSRTRGLYHLLSNTEPPILDVAIEWAAKVKSMVPR